MSLGRTHPAAGGQHDGHGLDRRELDFPDCLGLLTFDNQGFTVIAIFLGVLAELFFHQRFQALIGCQRFLDPCAFFFKFTLFILDSDLFKSGQLAQPNLQNSLSLGIGQVKFFHQDRFGLVAFSDNPYHFIQVQIGDQQSGENVPTLINFI